jgi:hypothetical protein
LRGIPATTPEQAGHLERIFDGQRRKRRVFDVEKIQSLPEYLGFVIFLHAQALPDVQASKALLKDMQFVADHLIPRLTQCRGTAVVFVTLRTPLPAIYEPYTDVVCPCGADPVNACPEVRPSRTLIPQMLEWPRTKTLQ